MEPEESKLHVLMQEPIRQTNDKFYYDCGKFGNGPEFFKKLFVKTELRYQ